jgi:hypothetical protein
VESSKSRAVSPDKGRMEAALIAISQASYQSKVSYAVAAKAMDAMRQQGGAAIELLKGAAAVQSKAVAQANEGFAAAMDQLSSAIDDNGRLDVTA